MNGLKGEKGDPADVLGLRVSTEPPGCWPCRRGTQPEGLPEDPSPLRRRAHVSLAQGLVAPLGQCVVPSMVGTVHFAGP